MYKPVLPFIEINGFPVSLVLIFHPLPGTRFHISQVPPPLKLSGVGYFGKLKHTGVTSSLVYFTLNSLFPEETVCIQSALKSYLKVTAWYSNQPKFHE
jgi:hypothetical protein